jgi:DNA-binding winged helix-turn-helix (wHTH) protein
MSGRIRFGAYELDGDAMELRKHGVPIRMQEQPFRVLAMLAARPGEVITREELQKQIWGNTFVDFDQSLNKAVNRVREVLNDNAGTPQYVETVPRRGYRFIAPVAASSQREAQGRTAPVSPGPAEGSVRLGSMRPPSRILVLASFLMAAPIRIAARDKRMLVLMVAVALLNAFPMIFKTWVWFYAKTKLGLSIGQTGAAMSWGLLLQIVVSYPAGWLIDRFGSYLALVIGWFLMIGLAVFSLKVHSASGLILLTVLYSLVMALKVAGDTILWKTMDKADTGSYTATVAMIRNFCTGTVIAISGFIIRWTGSYIAAFWFGFVLSSIALVVFFVYRHLMRAGGGLNAALLESGTAS